MGSSISNNKNGKKVLASEKDEIRLNISELDILRKAYEIFMENSNHCFGYPDISFVAKGESEEFNPMI